MVTKAMECRKWSSGEVTPLPLPQHASALGSPSRKVGFEACPGAGLFPNDGSEGTWDAAVGLNSSSLHVSHLEK